MHYNLDPYVVFSRYQLRQSLPSEFFRTEVIKDNINPEWKEITLKVSELTGIDDDQLISTATQSNKTNDTRPESDPILDPRDNSNDKQNRRTRAKESNSNNNNNRDSSLIDLSDESWKLSLDCFDYDAVGSNDIIGSCKVS